MPDTPSPPNGAPSLPAVYRSLGEVLRETREKAGRTQSEVAKAANLTRTSLTNIERGRQRLLVDTFSNIALFLGTTGSRMLSEVEARMKRQEPFTLPKGLPKNISNQIAGIITTTNEKSSHAKPPPTALPRKGRVSAR